MGMRIIKTLLFEFPAWLLGFVGMINIAEDLEKWGALAVYAAPYIDSIAVRIISAILLILLSIDSVLKFQAWKTKRNEAAISHEKPIEQSPVEDLPFDDSSDSNFIPSQDEIDNEVSPEQHGFNLVCKKDELEREIRELETIRAQTPTEVLSRKRQLSELYAQINDINRQLGD